MNTREWAFGDLNEIAALERECFDDPWNSRMLAESFLSGRFYGCLIEEDGAITAYGGIALAGEDAELELIAVSEMFRRCGRAKAILDDLVAAAKARGAKRMFLEVRVSNVAALSMYLRYGFVGIYARTRYYPNGEDALVMKKEL